MNIPTIIQLEDDGLLLEINNNKYIYPYKYLRLQCPCANCIEEMTGRKLLNVNSIPDDIFIVDYITIGNYAYQFLWSNADLCSTTGIFTYELLEILAKNDKAVKKV
ncbi:MAG: hypothetical protein CL712_04125 [Chloroflexi bacterium]|nr:hypothetical protein [Chloroflexota bacterium]